MYFGYYKLTTKGISEQVGFAISLVVIKTLILLGIIAWIIYRGVLIIKQTDTWQNVYHKMT